MFYRAYHLCFSKTLCRNFPDPNKQDLSVGQHARLFLVLDSKSLDNVKFSKFTKGLFFQIHVIGLGEYKEKYKISTCFKARCQWNIRGVTHKLTWIRSRKIGRIVKMLDKVTSFCVQVGDMMVNKCAKFQSHMSMDFENIRGITKTLTQVVTPTHGWLG
jgi:hypothetical protein